MSIEYKKIEKTEGLPFPFKAEGDINLYIR